MELSDSKKREYVKRILLSRMRILCNHGFYGLLLMHMNFAVDEEVTTSMTDGYKITLGTDFLDSISDGELDFVMMHEILHVVLQHYIRVEGYDKALYGFAADIVVNSIILQENNMDPRSITLQKYGELIHKVPNGKEGNLYTTEEVYRMLSQNGCPGSKGVSSKSDTGENEDENETEDGKCEGNTQINSTYGDSDDKGNKTVQNDQIEALGGMDTNDTEIVLKDSKSSDNSSKNNKTSSTDNTDKKSNDTRNRTNKSDNHIVERGSTWDDHSKWGKSKEDTALKDAWSKHLEDAAKAMAARDPSNSWGLIPKFAKRLLKEIKKPQTDWRIVLNDFVQEEINDYSFSPPDRRFDESPFYLPDFNEKDDSIENILFMIDTSGSMSNDMITMSYSEIKGAIDQFDGKFKGFLGFFDATVIEPVPFADEDEFMIIRPIGGGGTNFHIIFEYVAKNMAENPPVCIIILTDGYAPFPPEELANDIPVLWVINNENVMPPWGRVTRIK